MTEIRIEGAIDRELARLIGLKIEDTSATTKVSAGHCIHVKGFLGGTEYLAIIGGIAGVIQAVVALWSLYDQKKERTSWTYARALTIVRDEMASRKVTDFSVRSIEGFEHLLTRGHKPFILTVRDDNNGIEFEIMIFLDGSVCVFEFR